jgi:hypothetical protein
MIFWNLQLFTSWDSARQHGICKHSTNLLLTRNVLPKCTASTHAKYVGVQKTWRWSLSLLREGIPLSCFSGQREAAVYLQNAQYVQPASQLVPSSPSGCRKLIKEAHQDSVPSDYEERHIGSGRISVRRWNTTLIQHPSSDHYPRLLADNDDKFEAPTELIPIIHLFWVAMLSSEFNDYRRFESTHRFHLQWMSRRSITLLPSVTTT